MDWKNLLGWLIALVILAPFIIYTVPWMIGATQTYIVKSGSMEPAVPTGSVIFVRPTDTGELEQGDIITFQSNNGSEALTTHRIVDVDRSTDGFRFRTKGDANEDRDPGWVGGEDVVGKTFFTLPYMGYLIVWIGTPIGFAIFIILPAALLMLNEARKILQEVRGRSTDQ